MGHDSNHVPVPCTSPARTPGRADPSSVLISLFGAFSLVGTAHAWQRLLAAAKLNRDCQMSVCVCKHRLAFSLRC